jgi:carboxymethylenebutenolidase
MKAAAVATLPHCAGAAQGHTPPREPATGRATAADRSSCRLRTSRTFWLRERAGTSDGGSQRLRERAFRGGARRSILRGNNQVAEGTVELNELEELEHQGLKPRSRWSRRGFVMTSLATGFALSVQPVSAQTITTDTNGLDAGEVKVKVNDGEIPAYRAMPDKGGPFPTVLVSCEIWGVHEHIKDICRRLAKLGYYAIAPEMFARQGDPSKIADVPTLIDTIVKKKPTDEILSDLDATVAYAKSSGKADTSKLAVTGFCWGGFVTWMYATHNPGLKAAVSWYGSDRWFKEKTQVGPVEVGAEVKCPVLAFYGGQDQSIAKDIIEQRQQACKSAGKTCEFKIYPEAPHGFLADYRPSYRADDAKDAWARMLAWFKEHGVA